MALTIIHSGIRMYNVRVKDISAFDGYYNPLDADASTAYTRSLIGGRLVAIDSADGTLKLADGATDTAIGFLTRDFILYDLGSNTTPADGGLSIMLGDSVVRTDQIDPTITIAYGDKLYAGIGNAAGLITNVANGPLIGIAVNEASVASPVVEIIVKL